MSVKRIFPVQQIPAPTVPQKPKPTQASLFDLLTAPNNEKKEETSQEEIEENDKESIEETDNSPTEEPPLNLNIDVETGEVFNAKSFEEHTPNSFYRKYLELEKQYPQAVIVYRLGDFYEILGDKSIALSRELSLALNTKDCGLSERVYLIGFPYHSRNSYIEKIRQRRKVVVVDNDDIQVLERISTDRKIQKPTPTTPPSIETPVSNDNEIDEELKEMRAQVKHIDKDALCILLDLFEYELDVQ